MLLRALRTPVVMPGWHIREPACRNHAPLLYELESNLPQVWISRAGSLLCLSTCTHGREWAGLSICLQALVCLLMLPTEVRARWPKARCAWQAAPVCCRVRAC